MKKKYKRKAKKKTRHHILPKSRKGRNLEDNIMYVPNVNHQRYHALFSNLRPDEIIDYLVRSYWDNQSKWVDLYIERFRR